MKHVSIIGSGRFEVCDTSPPIPGPNDLLIAPLRVGICATDLELLDGSMVYLRTGKTSFPLTPGHEWVGRVVDLGRAVVDFAAGDIVVGECSVGCGHCAICSAGAYHRCLDRRETGIMGLGGGLTELMTFPSASAHAVPSGIGLEDAALVEPTAVAYRAILRLAPQNGSSVLIVGGGTLGYLAAAVLKNCFAMDVAVAASRETSLNRLRAIGVREPGVGEHFTNILEAAGTELALNSAFERLGPGGRLVLIGLTGLEAVPMPVDNIVVGDQEIIGSIGSPGVWPEVLRIIASGAVSPSALVTHTFSLQNFDQAIELLSQRDSTTGKILIAPNAE